MRNGHGHSDVSRDFWMSDHSCRVCYECDLQFTVFHRRHHCRICGRVFCAKCTSNFIPVLPDDPKFLQKEGERIRVCNYCLKRRHKELAAAANDIQKVTPLLSSSPSSASFASSKFNDTGNNSTTTAALVAHSAGAYNHPTCETAMISQSISNNSHPGKNNMLTSNMESVVDMGDPSPNEFRYCMNRSDYEDSEYGAYRSDSETHHFQTNEYYGPVMFEDIDQDQRSNEGYPAEENTNTKGIISEVQDETEFHASLDLGKTTERSGHDNSYECDASAIYGSESDTEHVDFENNGLLWLPPDPEDEEDERDPALFNDEDEEDATGEWGYLRSSNSFGSGEYRSRDRSSEEHKKAMKNVVDGHFRALVAQLLQIENLHMGKDDNRDGWLEIITTLSWEAATLLKPDTSKGGGMDPGGYVKVKCIACGRRSDSTVVRGVVCKKNVAHRHMSSKIGNPRLLILEGALEYQRVSNTLSSVDTLLQQETDHLKMAVAKIDARHPNVLLVEKSVSRFAQDCLFAKNISLVLNIKKSLLQRIARCTGAEIVPSIDHLSSQKLGHCDLFHAEKFFEEHGSAGLGEKKMIKTLMFFEGCPRPLGCTVVLKGANSDELKKVKRVVQFGVFAAYHLALETSFLADEGASLPGLPLKSPMAVALPDKPSSLEGSISMIPGVMIPGPYKPQLTNHQRPNASSSTVMINNLGDVSVYPSKGIKSASDSSSTFMCQYGDITTLAPLNHRNFNVLVVPVSVHHCLALGRDQQAGNVPVYSSPCLRSERSKMGYNKYSKLELLKDNNQINEEKWETSEKDRDLTNDTQIDNNQSIETQPGSSNLGVSHQGNAQSDEFALPKEVFPVAPSHHQSILVSLSSRCVWKGTVCERAHLLRIKYYGSFDKPLGRFLRDQLFDQGHRCRSCEMPSEAHVHCYTHQQGSLTLSVRYLSERLPGERDGKIWMWHRCLRCPRMNGFPPATRRVVMSDAAWGLSFGKFLELSFSNNAAASRVASCGHSLHRDCLRFYGFGKMVACFRYASINLHSVCLPPHKLDFNYQHQEWVQKEADGVADKAEQLFTEILNKMLQIADGRLDNGSSSGNMKIPEPSCNVIKLEEILHKERMEFQEYLRKLVQKDVNKGLLTIGILEVNNLRRRLFLQSYVWDWRLILFARDKNNARDVLSGFMAKRKEKLRSSDKLVDLMAPKPLKGFLSLDALPSRLRGDKFYKGREHATDHQEGPPDHLNKINADRERSHQEQDRSIIKQGKPSFFISTSSSDQVDPLDSGFLVHRVLPDGPFPMIADISDTLDARWTGGNGPAVVEATLSSSSTLVEATSTIPVSEDSDERSGDDVSRSLSFTSPTSSGVDAEDCPSWIEVPFSNLYSSFNRNIGNVSELHPLHEYNPVYINLFRDLKCQNGARLLFPIGVNDIVIPVYDDEPTSIISYVLASHDYHIQVSHEHERVGDGGHSSLSIPVNDSGIDQPLRSVDDISESLKTIGSTDSLLSMTTSRSSLILDPPSYAKAMNVRVSFTVDGLVGKVRYTVTCYCANHFDKLRKICCPSEVDFLRSLSRCKKWDAQGGKSNAFFAKSLDDRLIIKQVTKTELESFIHFAPEYFKYLSDSITTGSPTCLAKILGIYQVTTKHLKGGKESRMDVLVMENLLFGRTVTRQYDLKGSSRSRYNSDANGNNKVLLDQNLIEAMPTSPIFVGNKAKRLLERAVWNDTAFLASIDVMDYSLLVGVDEEKHELVLGIIDFMRQYTWDKHLETWVKASVILGAPKNELPTVISPMQYKKRFRKAMSVYFLVVPDQWSSPTIVPNKSKSDLCEDNQQSASVQS